MKTNKSLVRGVLGIMVLGLSFLFAATGHAESMLATLETSKGKIVIQLEPAKTPVTCASFVNLIQRGFFDGITFHRVIPGFVIQGGDPLGSGYGGPGYNFKDEFDPSLRHSSDGILSMANAGPGTNGSQFFITLGAQPHLDDRHSVFGRVVEGMDNAKKIVKGDKIIKATVTGDTDALLSSQAELVKSWNAVLDQKFPRK